jgi:hypothetical protein
VRRHGGPVVHDGGLGSEQGGTEWCGALPGRSLGAVGPVEFICRAADMF